MCITIFMETHLRATEHHVGLHSANCNMDKTVDFKIR